MDSKSNQAAATPLLEQNVRIGIVARCDNGGLGVMTFDFFRNLMVEKVLVISASYENYHDRTSCDNARQTKATHFSGNSEMAWRIRTPVESIVPLPGYRRSSKTRTDGARAKAKAKGKGKG